MSRRPRHSWLAWLLPLMVLRAFVPAGFMLSGTPDGLELMLCTGTGPAITRGADSSEHHAHHMSHAGGHEHHDAAAGEMHEKSYCPFALAASASAPTTLDIFASEPPLTGAIDFVSHPELRSAAVLIDRIRGPPRV